MYAFIVIQIQKATNDFQDHKKIKDKDKKVNKTINGDSKNFVQGVPIPLGKNFGSFRFISGVSGCLGKYQSKFKIWLA